MAFKFRFESILNLKIRMEDMKKAEFKSISEKLEEEKEKLKTVVQEREILYENMKKKQEEAITKQDMINYNNYLHVLKKKIELQKQVVIEVSEKLEKVRQELVKVSQEKKMFETLKEKKKEEYLKEYYKKEQEVVDNLTSFKFGRGEEDDEI